jgi:hypothetical protein
MAVLALATLAVPAGLAAQSRPEITPFVASYYGVTHLAEGDAGLFAGNPFTIDQNNAFALGARVKLPVGATFGVEAEFTYAMSGVAITEEDGVAPGIDGGISQDGNILFGSLRGVYTPRRSNLSLLAGPAIVKRGGDAWEGVDSGDITDFGGVVGLSLRANVTPRFRLNITAESYLYSFDGGGGDSQFQADLLVSIGVPIQLGK